MRRQEDSKIPGLRQLSVNLSHSRIRRQGDSEKPGLRRGTVQELYCVQGFLYTRLMTFCSNSGNVKRKLKQQDSSAKRERRIKQHSAVRSVEEVSKVFLSAVKEGPDYICACCLCLM